MSITKNIEKIDKRFSFEEWEQLTCLFQVQGKLSPSRGCPNTVPFGCGCLFQRVGYQVKFNNKARFFYYFSIHILIFFLIDYSYSLMSFQLPELPTYAWRFSFKLVPLYICLGIVWGVLRLVSMQFLKVLKVLLTLGLIILILVFLLNPEALLQAISSQELMTIRIVAILLVLSFLVAFFIGALGKLVVFLLFPLFFLISIQILFIGKHDYFDNQWLNGSSLQNLNNGLALLVLAFIFILLSYVAYWLTKGILRFPGKGGNSRESPDDGSLNLNLKSVLFPFLILTSSTFVSSSYLEARTMVNHPGDVWIEENTGIKFVQIKGNCLPGKKTPSKKIAKDKSLYSECVSTFWMSQFEISNNNYWMFHPYHEFFYSKQGSAPVNRMNWEDIQAFLSWLSDKYNRKLEFRLPTKAEWEFACLAGTGDTNNRWSDKESVCQFENVADLSFLKSQHVQPEERDYVKSLVHQCDDQQAYPEMVGFYKPNPFGLYDMLGNISEVCIIPLPEYVDDGHIDGAVFVNGERFSKLIVKGPSYYHKPGNITCGAQIPVTLAEEINAVLDSDMIGIRLVMNPVSSDYSFKFDDDMVLIDAGSFLMGDGSGSQSERPAHEVYTRHFLIDKFEVTVEKYKQCVDAKKCKAPVTGKNYNWNVNGRDHHPVNGVSWYDANDYCHFAGKRLPTEAEWEKAASRTRFPIDKKADFPSGLSTISCNEAVINEGGAGCGKGGTWPVGRKSREINGTYDMAGNLYEWVSDRFGPYNSEFKMNPTGPDKGGKRVTRGGSWYFRASEKFPTSTRSQLGPASRISNLGFRCAKSLGFDNSNEE